MTVNYSGASKYFRYIFMYFKINVLPRGIVCEPYSISRVLAADRPIQIIFKHSRLLLLVTL